MSEVLYYAGGRDQHVGAYVFRVRNDGTFDLLELAPSLSIRAHSPTGFEWGYGGSGPAHLAIALLLEVTGDPALAAAHYQDYKWGVVCRLSEDGWRITAESIREWLRLR